MAASASRCTRVQLSRSRLRLDFDLFMMSLLLMPGGGVRPGRRARVASEANPFGTSGNCPFDGLALQVSIDSRPSSSGKTPIENIYH